MTLQQLSAHNLSIGAAVTVYVGVSAKHRKRRIQRSVPGTIIAINNRTFTIECPSGKMETFLLVDLLISGAEQIRVEASA